MLLSKMRVLPETAGDVARLQFFKPAAKKTRPYRKGQNIFLPLHTTGSFFPLRGGKQFLYSFKYDGLPIDFFGGTDEQTAFLTHLTVPYGSPSPFWIFQKRGERAFYRALKPRLISMYERQFGTQAVRQGDIYAVRIPRWEAYRRAWAVLFGSDHRLQLKPAKARWVFSMRHQLRGFCTKEMPGITATTLSGQYGGLLFGEGVLSHPEHSPRELEGVHLVMQSLATVD